MSLTSSHSTLKDGIADPPELTPMTCIKTKIAKGKVIVAFKKNNLL